MLKANVDSKHISDEIHRDLLAVINHIYEPNKLQFDCLQVEDESSEYGAYRFKLNDCKILFRVAKITPKKVGQFVTIWKRVRNGPIQPYDISDPIDLIVISVREGDQFGQFVFPKSILREHEIISNNGNGGKRGIRVYPPWDKLLNKQAQKT
jgi:hypothetical protein